MIEPTDKEVIESLQSVIRVLGADNERLRQDAARSSGWLIETGRGTYWDGESVLDKARFTQNTNVAIRFTRQEDAERVRIYLLELSNEHRLRSSEHVFIDAQLAKEQP